MSEKHYIYGSYPSLDMKIRVLEKSYEEVMALPRAEHKYPARPSRLLHLAMRIGSGFDLRDVGFTYDATDLKRALLQATVYTQTTSGMSWAT